MGTTTGRRAGTEDKIFRCSVRAAQWVHRKEELVESCGLYPHSCNTHSGGSEGKVFLAKSQGPIAEEWAVLVRGSQFLLPVLPRAAMCPGCWTLPTLEGEYLHLGRSLEELRDSTSFPYLRAWRMLVHFLFRWWLSIHSQPRNRTIMNQKSWCKI